jgi:ribosome biogenesis GTPase
LATEQQILAANVDEVLVVEALAMEPKLRRIERFLTLAWDSGATPRVILTKMDLCPDPVAAVEATRSIAGDAEVLAVSGKTGKGMRSLRKYLKPGRTAVLLGPSGVGKSTLINFLNGEETQAVLPIRDGDNKGRHTTTHRELVLLPNGGLIIDTPGLREIQLWEGLEGVAEAFPDIQELSRTCKFTNCTHQAEPGCAVRKAIETGALDKVRFESFQKLLKESRQFEGKHTARARLDETRRAKALTRSLRGNTKYQHDPGDEDD